MDVGPREGDSCSNTEQYLFVVREFLIVYSTRNDLLTLSVRQTVEKRIMNKIQHLLPPSAGLEDSLSHQQAVVTWDSETKVEGNTRSRPGEEVVTQ